jgi:hypothetical protein
MPDLIRQVPPIESGITVSMAISILAELALQQMLEIVVSEADVAGLFVGVLELLVEVAVLDLDAFLVARDLVEACPTVRATV